MKIFYLLFNISNPKTLKQRLVSPSTSLLPADHIFRSSHQPIAAARLAAGNPMQSRPVLRLSLPLSHLPAVIRSDPETVARNKSRSPTAPRRAAAPRPQVPRLDGEERGRGSSTSPPPSSSRTNPNLRSRERERETLLRAPTILARAQNPMERASRVLWFLCSPSRSLGFEARARFDWRVFLSLFASVCVCVRAHLCLPRADQIKDAGGCNFHWWMVEDFFFFFWGGRDEKKKCAGTLFWRCSCVFRGRDEWLKRREAGN